MLFRSVIIALKVPLKSRFAGALMIAVAQADSLWNVGIKTAADLLAAGTARLALVVNPEICSGHLNFRDRDSHFIFGDVATAVIIEPSTTSGDFGLVTAI